MRSVVAFGVKLGAAALISWMADGTMMETIIMFALLDISTKVPR